MLLCRAGGICYPAGMYRSEPLPLSFWIVNPFDDIPGEGLPPLRYWSLARVLASRGHDVTWWTAAWSHRRKAARTTPIRIRDEEGFAVRLVAVRPYTKNVSFTRLASHRDFGRTFERLANESIASGQLERPDMILASLPPLEGPEAALRLAKRLDANLVVDLMDVWPETFERLVPGPQWLKRALSPLLFGRMATRRRALLESADAVSSCAHGYLDAIPEATSRDQRTHVCHLGAWLPEFPAPPRLIDEVPHTGATEPSAAAADQPAGGAAAQPLACVYAGTGSSPRRALRPRSTSPAPVGLSPRSARRPTPSVDRAWCGCMGCSIGGPTCGCCPSATWDWCS